MRRLPCARRTGFGIARAALAIAVLAAVAGGAPSQAEESRPAHVVNVNTATAQELEELPGVGAARARAIVEAREKRGGFKSVDDLLEVKGIGEAGLEKLRPLVSVDGKSPVRRP
jgi:competence protein ComEA